MRLSDRVNSLAASSTLAVSATVKALAAKGINVIDFGLGEPDFDTPQPIKDAAISALLVGKTHYTAVPGEPAARQAIADKLNRENSIACTADDIVITAGAKVAIYMVLQCLLDPLKKQRVILPTPAWVSYRPLIELAGGNVVELAGPVANDFKITPDQLDAAIDADTVAIILNSPSNPCGTMYTPSEITALAAVLANHPHVTIITDEIYEKIIFGDARHLSIGSFPEVASRTITINGMSKAFAMTGWRIGYLCAPGDKSLVAKAVTKMQGQMTGNITAFCYDAIVAAMTRCSASIESMRTAFAQRSELVARHLAAIPDLPCPKPAGAFYVFPDIRAYLGRTSPAGRRITTACELAQALLEEAHVAVVPGEDYGEIARTHIRISYACSPDTINEGCRRIAHWLGSLK